MSSFPAKNRLFQFGEVIPNLTIDGKPAPYPVLNDRVVRAGAGINLVLGGSAFSLALLDQNYQPLKYVVALFFIDFFLKVVFGPQFSPISRIAEWIVAHQRPEYVGAVQKRFAWSIGLVMSFIMVILMYAFEIQGLPNRIICGICLTFMWLETSFGICVGCKMYYGLITLGLVKKPEIAPACPGGACPIRRPA